MCICVLVFVCISECLSMYVWVCVSVLMCMFMYVPLFICMHLYVYQCVCLYVCVWHGSLCLYVCACVCASVCASVWMCVWETEWIDVGDGAQDLIQYSVTELYPFHVCFLHKFQAVFSHNHSAANSHQEKNTVHELSITACHFFYSRSLLSSLRSLARPNLLLIPFDLEELFLCLSRPWHFSENRAVFLWSVWIHVVSSHGKIPVRYATAGLLCQPLSADWFQASHVLSCEILPLVSLFFESESPYIALTVLELTM